MESDPSHHRHETPYVLPDSLSRLSPAIDMPFGSEVFQKVTLTQASLRADAAKAFEEAKREIEKQMPAK